MQQSFAIAGANPAMTTVRSVNYGPVHTQSFPQYSTISHEPLKTDFGKIKGVEILYFRNAQLERNVGGSSGFASMGPLQVVYFPQYDRFVLSLNSWKYPLLKRIPVVGSSASHGLPVTYTLPTINGYFSLIITRVEHMESLANLEAIFADQANFTVTDSDEVSSHGNILGGVGHQTHLHGSQYLSAPPTSSLPLNGNIMQSTHSPRYNNLNTSQLGQSFNNNFQANNSQVVIPGKKKSNTWSRIFKKAEYGRDTGDRVGSSRHNLNLIQKRDVNSMKMTSEVMAAVHYFPRKEVERWIVYNKEMASMMGFSPELADQDLTAFGHSILNRSSTENSDPSLPCNQPITSDRPRESITYQVGQNFASATRHDGKLKSTYIQGHSHSIHPDVSGRWNNLSTSDFQADRFKNMTNTSALYEASGISPISKADQPFTFNQIVDTNNILSEEKAPIITQRVSNVITGSNITTEPITTMPQESHVSFADKVKNLVHHEHETIPTTTTAISHPTTTMTQPTTISQPIRNVESRIIDSNVVQGNIHHVTQPAQVLESRVIGSQVLSGSTVPTQYLSGSTVTSTLPTLQERIRLAGASGEKPSMGQRIKNAFQGTERTDVTGQHHYAA